MKARRVARELALLSFSQMSKIPDSNREILLTDLIVNTVRTLSEYSLKNLKNTIPDLLNVKEYLDDAEVNHPDNLNSPIDADILPINLPKTDEFKKYVDIILDSAESILHAIEIVEICAISEKQEVIDYAISLIKVFADNSEDIDGIINKFSEGWPIDRLLKLDKNILRIAVAEMKYMDDVPCEVSIDEAVDLIKRYSSDESSKFVNGILGHVYSNLKEKKPEETRKC